MTDREQTLNRIKEITGWSISPARLRIVTDTTEWMNIHRGNVIRLGCGNYAVRGNMSETRFGIDEQPKYWVFSAIDLADGSEKIIKTVFNEEFTAHISILKIRCYRSPEKEGNVLELVTGDDRFMQGITCYDEKGNNVRVIDFIKGKNFFHLIPAISKPHEQYFNEDFPQILWKLLDSIEAIELLHKHKLCHGDIRNDHIIIDGQTGKYRWIDFDLKQDVSDFDLWSIGNILAYATGKGIVTFSTVLKSKAFSEEIKQSLATSDSSAFYEYRIMNLKKIFPYIPERLSRILQHFTIKPIAFYSSIKELLEDYREMLELDFSAGKSS